MPDRHFAEFMVRNALDVDQAAKLCGVPPGLVIGWRDAPEVAQMVRLIIIGAEIVIANWKRRGFETPNAATQAAMKEAREGGVETFADTDALLSDLNQSEP